MPRITKLPSNATPLWRWMHEHRVTLEELGELLDVTPNHVGDVRRGVRRPPDALKFAIEAVTKQWEADHGIRKPRGVDATDWYQPVEAKRAVKLARETR